MASVFQLQEILYFQQFFFSSFDGRDSIGQVQSGTVEKANLRDQLFAND